MAQNSENKQIDNEVYNPICYINVKLATIDSPKFRASVNYFEDQLNEFIKLLDGLTKLIELYTKEYMKCNNFNDSIIKRFLIFKDKDILDNISKTVLQILNDNINIIYSYKINMVDDLFEKIISELFEFCQMATKDINEKKHSYDKSLDKYEFILNKYSSVSKSKDPNSLVEMYNQVKEMKKKYINNGIELCESAITFKTKLNQLLYKLFTFFYEENVNYHTSILNSFDLVKPDFNNLKEKLDEKKDIVIPNYEKSGWLFKKYQKGWNRRYFSIKKGVFKYSMTSSSGKKRGFVWTSTPINVLLCEVKEEPNNDRRFCFSVLTAKKTYILQAENEKELKEWLSTFDNAKHEKLKNLSNNVDDVQRNNEVTDNVSDNEVKIEDEDEDGEYLSRPYKGQINSIHLTPNVILYQNEQYETKNKEFHAIIEDVKEDEYLIYSFSCAMQHSVTIQGSIFLTIDYIYFYSKLFRYVTKYKIPFRDIVSIDIQTGVVYNIISIKTNENDNNEYIIKMYLKDISKVYRIINTIWENNTSKIQLNAQEIFDKIYEVDEISDDSESIDESLIENLNETENNSIAEGKRQENEEKEQKSEDKKKNNEIEKKEPEVDKIDSSKQINDVQSRPITVKSDVEKENRNNNNKTETETTASNKNKYALPANIPKPAGPIVCNEILERKVREVILPIPAKQLNDILFGNDTWLLQKIREKKKEFDMNVSEWTKNSDGNNERLVNYMIPVNNVLVKDKETITNESQICLKSDDYLLYIYECLARTPKMPYGEYFLPVLKYIITYQTETTCKLNISVGIRWSKSPNYIIKNAIKSPTLKGLVESAEGTLSAVIPECERLANEDNGTSEGDGSTSIDNNNNNTQNNNSQLNRRKSIAFSIYTANDSPVSTENTEESSNGFNLITIIVSVLFGISFILNIILLMKKGNTQQVITIKPKIQLTQALDYCTELMKSDFKPWNDILTLELGKGHINSIERFLDSHFKSPFLQDLGGDTLFNIDNVKTPTSNQPKNFTYFNKDNSLIYFRFQDSYNNIQSLKKEILRTYNDLDIYENKLIIMEYFNWFSDILEKCIDTDKRNSKMTSDISDLYDKDGNLNNDLYVKLPNGKIIRKKLQIASCYFDLKNALENND
ncbi:hypothetical protein H8356DRAFT_921137 [Neocallimastix lanati (nom. inval.)]|uniref:Uncharacterized protein n=1 Tax=Neocallimastix californiae TaxID=1754190 RepID=A0A1Y2EPL2_9FUNG|nr:hypothetical protein H8356DRAFT_921137 [Neocallimastix sp. JGI-2020a]ORY72795.1 hypothetical protein LY90DRAFT_666905 [Neocallimastix californiae]|eukprot:ORY72795.1 hypothetical protein LY90DRAFT_666905 [Neocallimastix californiae]